MKFWFPRFLDNLSIHWRLWFSDSYVLSSAVNIICFLVTPQLDEIKLWESTFWGKQIILTALNSAYESGNQSLQWMKGFWCKLSNFIIEKWISVAFWLGKLDKKQLTLIYDGATQNSFIHFWPRPQWGHGPDLIFWPRPQRGQGPNLIFWPRPHRGHGPDFIFWPWPQ